MPIQVVKLPTMMFTRLLSPWRKWIRTVECGILAIKKTSMKTLQIGLYRKYPNLVRIQVEIISDPNYLVHTSFTEI